MKTTLLVLTLTAGLADTPAIAQASTPAQASTSGKPTVDKTADQPQAGAVSTRMDARFNSWLGCWRLEDDLTGTGARMCITPEQTGVRLQTLVGTQRGTDELLIADGVERPIADTDCKGTERAEWSNDDQRVFRSTEVTCNNESARTIKSVAFLLPSREWVNVQHVSGNGVTTAVRAQRYRRAINQNLADGSKAVQPTTSIPAGDARWSIEDVIEASAKLPEDAVQAALTDIRQRFNINSKTLVALDDAGVSDRVIDLMIALAYPQRFVVERAGGSAPIGVSTGMGWYDPFMSPIMAGAYGNCYMDRYYGYRSYYNMCGSYYSPYGGYFPYQYRDYNYIGNGNGWITVDPNPTPIESGTGRVVNGRGYTQIRERSPEPSSGRSSNGGNGTAAGWSGNSGGGASSGGYSSGSSGSSSGGGGGSSSGGGERTAVARPPGGN